MSDEQGCVLRCDEAGTLVEITTDTLGLAQLIQPGLPLTRLAAQGSLAKMLSFLQAVRAQGQALDWEINLSLGDSIKTLHFDGSQDGADLLIIAAENRGQLMNFYQELVRMNNEQADRLRLSLKSQQEESLLFDEISRLNNELVAAQRELAKQNARLEQLNQEKNQLLGMAAHDLRNPLHRVLIVSDYLKEMDPASLGERYGEFLSVIHDSVKFMASLVDNLLDVAAIESGKLALDYSVQDLPRLVEHNAAHNQALAARKQIDIQLHMDDFPPVIVDAAKLEQVLNNLLSNAIKFSPQGGSIQVRLELQAEAFCLSIRDHGLGMTAEEQAGLFTGFKRGRPGTGGEKSTGLGLVIVRRIVSGHGGTIWFESAPGQGTTAYVSIPLQPPQKQ
jgi:signal transduction histidine kinase